MRDGLPNNRLQATVGGLGGVGPALGVRPPRLNRSVRLRMGPRGMVTLILPCVAFVQVLAVDTPAVKARTACPVSIEVGGTELLSSCSVDPTIESGGAELIYIPTHPPRGFIVERLDPETVPGTRFEPV